MNNWYNKNWCKQQQQSLYDFLVVKHKISIELLPSFVYEFKSRHIIEEKGNQRSIRDVLMHITSNEGFGKFLAIITEKTGVTFKKNKHKRRRKSYDTWWNECNMDGSFAYNGVTDDF